MHKIDYPSTKNHDGKGLARTDMSLRKSNETWGGSLKSKANSLLAASVDNVESVRKDGVGALYFLMSLSHHKKVTSDCPCAASAAA